MPDRSLNRNKNSRKAKPIQDIKTANKQANSFPMLGANLSSYQNQSNVTKFRGNNEETIKKPLLKRIFNKKVIKRTILTLLIVFLCTGVFLGGKFIYDLSKTFNGNIFGLLFPTKLKGEDSGRVNILLAGYSADDPSHAGAELTDSIMLVSIDTKNNTAWMLSVPRDLWVNIPGYGYQKINAAYEDGQSDNFSAGGYPNGGMGELEQIVSQKFGIPIDYYALIDYTAFKQAVDAVGGITINIQSTDPRGLYDAYTHLKLPNGWVTLDGQQALNLARARGDNAAGDISYGFANSDFDRTLHQRQMLLALKQKVGTTGVISNPISLSQLFDAMGNNVKTDFNVSDIRRLYSLSKKIPTNKIQSLSLNNSNGINLLTGYYTSDGQDALVPVAGINNYSAIQEFVSQHTQN